MIASAAVKIYDKRQNVIVTIPCHRHADAFQILEILAIVASLITMKSLKVFLMKMTTSFLALMQRRPRKSAANWTTKLKHKNCTQRTFGKGEKK